MSKTVEYCQSVFVAPQDIWHILSPIRYLSVLSADFLSAHLVGYHSPHPKFWTFDIYEGVGDNHHCFSFLACDHPLIVEIDPQAGQHNRLRNLQSYSERG